MRQGFFLHAGRRGGVLRVGGGGVGLPVRFAAALAAAIGRAVRRGLAAFDAARCRCLSHRVCLHKTTGNTVLTCSRQSGYMRTKRGRVTGKGCLPASEIREHVLYAEPTSNRLAPSSDGRVAFALRTLA